VIRALKNLSLFGNRVNDRFQRGVAVGHAKCALLDLRYDLCYAAAD
jgi:hypothetical protein